MSRNSWLLGLVAIGSALVLAGCGGGGGSSGGSVSGVGGVAATGRPISGGKVTMICAGGTESSSVTTGSDGTYSNLTASGALPCIIKITSGTTNGTLYSVLNTGTAANINQLTTMLVYGIAGGDPQTVLFGTPSNIAVLVTSNLVAQKAIVQKVVTAFSALTLGSSFDFLTTS